MSVPVVGQGGFANAGTLLTVQRIAAARFMPPQTPEKFRNTSLSRSPGRTFSWAGGSRGALEFCERIQRIMKFLVGNAHGDRGVNRHIYGAAQ